MANEIYVDPNAAGAAVIMVGGQLYNRVGGVGVAPAVLSFNGQLEPCEDPSCTSPCADAPSNLAIPDYTDIYFMPCPDGTPPVPGDCVWDRVFDYFDSQTCSYSNRYCFDGGSCFDCSFNEYRTWEFQPPVISDVWYEIANNALYMQITGQNGQDSSEIVGQGRKITGPGFSGIYAWTSGCVQGSNSWWIDGLRISEKRQCEEWRLLQSNAIWWKIAFRGLPAIFAQYRS